MKQLKILVPIAFVCLGLTALPAAHAEEQDRTTTPRKTTKRSSEKKKVLSKKVKPTAKKTKNFDFMADDITADRIRPDGTAIFGLQTVNHNSLIRLRSEFIAEIVKSAEML